MLCCNTCQYQCKKIVPQLRMVILSSRQFSGQSPPPRFEQRSEHFSRESLGEPKLETDRNCRSLRKKVRFFETATYVQNVEKFLFREGRMLQSDTNDVEWTQIWWQILFLLPTLKISRPGCPKTAPEWHRHLLLSAKMAIILAWKPAILFNIRA